MTTAYRLLLVFLLVLLLTSFFFPWSFVYDNGSIAALGWLGANALIGERAIIALSNVLTVVYTCAYIGMIFYKKWARALLTTTALLGGLAIPLYGMSVQSGYEAMLGYFATLGDGIVIALSFFSELRLKFSKPG